MESLNRRVRVSKVFTLCVLYLERSVPISSNDRIKHSEPKVLVLIATARGIVPFSI